MNKTKQLYKLFESFRSFLLLLNHMKYSTNIFSLGYFISKVLRLNIWNNRICTKAFILILFPYPMPIFSDKAALIFQREFYLWVFPVSFQMPVAIFPFPSWKWTFFSSFPFSSAFSPSRSQVRGNRPKNKFKKKSLITLKKQLDNFLVLCCYFLCVLSPISFPVFWGIC